jgi:Holliday junction resolvasome RuvABC endonuclease subunit
MIIGIDFSINSTAVTINDNGNLIIYSFVPNFQSGKAAFRTHDALTGIVSVISYTKDANTKDSLEDQRIKIRNANELSNQIIDNIRPYLDKAEFINIEGFSFGSKGNSFIDLITYNTFLKVKLLQIVGEKIWVIPPKSIKKIYTGNGNASKCQMVNRFLEEPSLLKNKIDELGFVKEGEYTIPKPIDDIVDSIALSRLNPSTQSII